MKNTRIRVNETGDFCRAIKRAAHFRKQTISGFIRAALVEAMEKCRAEGWAVQPIVAPRDHRFKNGVVA